VCVVCTCVCVCVRVRFHYNNYSHRSGPSQDVAYAPVEHYSKCQSHYEDLVSTSMKQLETLHHHFCPPFDCSIFKTISMTIKAPVLPSPLQQWTINGLSDFFDTPANLLRWLLMSWRKLRTVDGSSGVLWSGQAVKWYWCTLCSFFCVGSVIHLTWNSLNI